MSQPACVHVFEPKPRGSLWRDRLPKHADLSAMVSLCVNVRLGPGDRVFYQDRKIPLAITRDSTGAMFVRLCNAVARVSPSGEFLIRAGTGPGEHGWREAVSGRIRGKTVVVFYYECRYATSAQPGRPSSLASLWFVGWAESKITRGRAAEPPKTDPMFFFGAVAPSLP